MLWQVFHDKFKKKKGVSRLSIIAIANLQVSVSYRNFANCFLNSHCYKLTYRLTIK
jgi:hypothetical protein